MKLKLKKNSSWQDVPCKLWTGFKKPSGYGQIKRERKTWRVHRWVWTQEHGPIPAKMEVCHYCDVRACYEGKHLFLGTRKQNMEDCKAKGRNSRGEMIPQSKLIGAQVIEIRRRYKLGAISQRDLAAEFGVDQSLVSRIVNEKMWTHV